MLKNREIRIFIFILSTISLCGIYKCYEINVITGRITLTMCIIIIIVVLVFTKWRYKKLANLATYLNSIHIDKPNPDVRDSIEGELSILKNEIYKVTIMLTEQATLLKKDKLYLSDSLSDISHQLKTPLTSMLITVDLLRDSNLPHDKRIEFTDTIYSQLQRIEWLVSTLLKMSKIDSGTIIMKKEKINVSLFINKSIEHLLIPAELKDLHIIIKGNNDTAFTGDFHWMAEAVSNIVKNAIEHTPIGGKIIISFDENTLYTRFSISNTGEPIDKEDILLIFNRFYKGKNSNNDSVGIGLAMAKSIIMKNGGIITVNSSTILDTEFIIKIYKGIV